VLAELARRVPAVCYEDAPPTTLVATIYFDSADGYFLGRANSQTGISSVKVRAREYLPISDDDERRVLSHSPDCYLERKERTGTIRQKDRLRIAKSDLASIIDNTMQVPCQILQDEIS